jgi:predicted dehydrogenase
MKAEPKRVQAFARFENDVDMELSGVLWFADGRMASFDCGFTAPMRQWVEVVGEQGVLRMTDLFDPAERAAYVVEPKGGKAETTTLEPADHIRDMVDAFANAVRRGERSGPGLEHTVPTLRVMDALARSAREGRAVDV